MKTKIELTKKEFTILKNFTYQYIGRDALRHVYVFDDSDNKKVYAVASDGKCIIQFQLKDPYQFPLTNRCVDTFQTGSYELIMSGKDYFLLYNEKAIEFPKSWKTIINPQYSMDVITIYSDVNSYAKIICRAIDQACTKFTVIPEESFKKIPKDEYTIRIDKAHAWSFHNKDVSIQIAIMSLQDEEHSSSSPDENFKLNVKQEKKDE